MPDITIQRFGDGSPVHDGSADYLGGKGARLVEMSAAGIPVPPGFVIPTTAMNNYFAIRQNIMQSIILLEEANGEHGNEWLWSVRSGAKFSMPGMMDTILNIGLNDENLDYWKSELGGLAALDCYRRLFEMFGTTVYGMAQSEFEQVKEKARKFSYGAVAPTCDAEMTTKHWERVIKGYKSLFKKYDFYMPQSLEKQIELAVYAVWNSWHSDRATQYRKDHGIPHDLGTAVTIQKMVFGNRDWQSASGVYFTRNPATGEPSPMGEYLVNAQGEDVVAGTRTPESIDDFEEWNPGLWDDLKYYGMKLEEYHGDMQDIEFTVDSGELYILQSRNGKRTPQAAFKIAHDMMQDGYDITGKVSWTQYRQLGGLKVREGFGVSPFVTGLGAGGSVVTGKVVKSSADAVAASYPCILVTQETSPDDYPGMVASMGILTATGGMTCHAAVVGRSINKTCVVGAGETVMDLKAGDTITLCGATGRVWVGCDVPTDNEAENPVVHEVIYHLIKDCPQLIAARPKQAEELAAKYPNLSFDVQVMDKEDLAYLPKLNKAKALGVARAVLPFGEQAQFARFVGLRPEEIRDHLNVEVTQVVGKLDNFRGVDYPSTIRELLNTQDAVDLINLPSLTDDDFEALQEVTDGQFVKVGNSKFFNDTLREVLDATT